MVSLRRSIALTCLAVLCTPRSVIAQRQISDEALIRTARARFNGAIAAHDTAAMAKFWLPEYHGVSSRNTQSNGRDEERAGWTELFASRPALIFVRTPRTVTVNANWGQSWEAGRWTGQWMQHDSLTRVGGEYFAKWKKVDGRWMILAEIFVQTSCKGSSYCNAPPIAQSPPR